MAQTSSRSGRLCLVAPASRAAPRDAKRVRPFRRQQAQDVTRPQLRPIPAWSWMLAAAAAVALDRPCGHDLATGYSRSRRPGTDQANARLDAVRTGLAAGAGAGAAVGLMLAFRRQHHQEITTAQTDHDATERRITELYTKAVEQLGSDKAPVRLGGLYAWNAFPKIMRHNARPLSTSSAPTCACPFPRSRSPVFQRRTISGTQIKSTLEPWYIPKRQRCLATRKTSTPYRATYPLRPPTKTRRKAAAGQSFHYTLLANKPGSYRRHAHRLRPRQ